MEREWVEEMCLDYDKRAKWPHFQTLRQFRRRNNRLGEGGGEKERARERERCHPVILTFRNRFGLIFPTRPMLTATKRTNFPTSFNIVYFHKLNEKNAQVSER